jgi:hypothetical protein
VRAFKSTMDGEPVAISINGECRDVVRESLFVVGRGTGSTADYQLDVAYDEYSFKASCSLCHDLSCCCRFWL